MKLGIIQVFHSPIFPAWVNSHIPPIPLGEWIPEPFDSQLVSWFTCLNVRPGAPVPGRPLGTDTIVFPGHAEQLPRDELLAVCSLNPFQRADGALRTPRPPITLRTWNLTFIFFLKCFYAILELLFMLGINVLLIWEDVVIEFIMSTEWVWKRILFGLRVGAPGGWVHWRKVGMCL